MDIASLDLNQVIPLCIKHGMHNALVHVFTAALQDYHTPAALLLVAAASAGSDPLQQETALRLGYKPLLYLQSCLAGLRYPPGRITFTHSP